MNIKQALFVSHCSFGMPLEEYRETIRGGFALNTMGSIENMLFFE